MRSLMRAGGGVSSVRPCHSSTCGPSYSPPVCQSERQSARQHPHMIHVGLVDQFRRRRHDLNGGSLSAADFILEPLHIAPRRLKVRYRADGEVDHSIAIIVEERPDQDDIEVIAPCLADLLAPSADAPAGNASGERRHAPFSPVTAKAATLERFCGKALLAAAHAAPACSTDRTSSAVGSLIPFVSPHDGDAARFMSFGALSNGIRSLATRKTCEQEGHFP
jgi:hypothetical protein